MKKLLRFADCFVLLAAIIGCILRLWLQNTGIDKKGLYQTGHPAWLLLCGISVAIVAFLWFVTRAAGEDRRYEVNYPRSKVGGATYVLLALVLTYVGITELLDTTRTLDQVTALVCLLSAVMVGATAVERFGGHQPAPFLHFVPCIFFALRLFQTGRDLGTEPEVCTFLFGFLAAISLVLAFYHLWAFDMNMGNRRRSLFWSLAAAYFCLITTFESAHLWVQYMVFAGFLLSNLCQLKYLPAPETAAAEAQTSGEAEEEVPAEAERPVAEAEVAEEATEEETEAAEAVEEIEKIEATEEVEEIEEIEEIEAAEETEEIEVIEEVTPAEEVAEEILEEEIPAEEAVAEEVQGTVAEETEFVAPPLCTPKESQESAFLKETEHMQKKACLRTDIDPDEDLDAFLADIKLFLEDEG